MSYQLACELDELKGVPLGVTVEGTDLALVQADGEIFAILDQCSHGAVPLSEGDVTGCEIECYLHGATFDLRTGRATGLPATEPVPVYPTRIVDGQVLVDLANPIDPNTSRDADASDQNMEN